MNPHRLVLPLALLVPCAVMALTADVPRWSVGDRWMFRQVGGLPPTESTWARQVVAELPDGRFEVLAPRAGRTWTFDAHGNQLDSKGAAYSQRRIDLPLRPGKRWTHERAYENGMITGEESSTWTVASVETLTVPAGTFECARVEGETFRNWTNPSQMNQSFNRARTETTYWYCPEIKWVARQQVREQADAAAPYVTTVYELIEYRPARVR